MWPQVLLAVLSTAQPDPAQPSLPDFGEVSSFTEVTEGWQEDPALDLTEALLRSNDGAVFATAEGGACIDIGRGWSEDLTTKNWLWAYCPAAPDGGVTSNPCQKLISPVTLLSVLGERCPSAAEAFAELEAASCQEEPKELERILRRASSMRIHVPTLKDKQLKEIWRLRHIRRGPFQEEKIGCVNSVTSPDGRVRVWVIRSAYREAGVGLIRGQAYLQWLTPEGKLGLIRNGAREELLLDSTLDGIVPVPGRPHEYLLTGYSPLGFDHLRFAEVLTLEGERPRLAKGRFLVNGQTEDVLIVTGGVPETGKPRHSPVYGNWIRLKDHHLWGAPIPGEEQLLPARKPFVMGEWTGEVFEMKDGGWARMLSLRGERIIHPSKRREPSQPAEPEAGPTGSQRPRSASP